MFVSNEINSNTNKKPSTKTTPRETQGLQANSPRQDTYVGGEGRHDKRGQDSWDCGSGVGDAKHGASEGRSDVTVVDEVA